MTAMSEKQTGAIAEPIGVVRHTAPTMTPEVAADLFASALRDVTEEHREAFRRELRWRVDDALVRREVVYLRMELEPHDLLVDALARAAIPWGPRRGVQGGWGYANPFSFHSAIARVTRGGKEPTDARAAAIADIRERLLILADNLYEHDITEDEYRVLSDKLTRAAWDLTPREQRKVAPEVAHQMTGQSLIKPHETAEFLLWVAGDAHDEDLAASIIEIVNELRTV